MTGQDLPEAAAAAVARIARDLGAQVLPEGSDPAQLLAPAAALRIACQVELAARAQVGVYIRRSREDGLSRHEPSARPSDRASASPVIFYGSSGVCRKDGQDRRPPKRDHPDAASLSGAGPADSASSRPG